MSRAILPVLLVLATILATSPVSAETLTFQHGAGSIGDFAFDTSLQSNLGPWHDQPEIFTYDSGTPDFGQRMALCWFHQFIGNAIQQVPLGTDIEFATLRLKTTSAGHVPGATVDVYRMLMFWDQEWTWNSSQYSGNGVQPGGLEAAADPTDSFTAPAQDTYIDIDVTTDVQAFLDGSATNYGWLIYADFGPRAEFHSSQAPLLADRPLLIVETAPVTCDGDANGDGAIDVNDVAYVIFRLGTCATGGTPCPNGCDGDANADGVVDVNDISYAIFRLGSCEPPGFTCP